MNSLLCCKKYNDKDILCEHHDEKDEIEINNYFLKICLKKMLTFLLRINT